MPDYFDWSAERIAELKRLWTDLAMSAGVIARRWGITRNSVIGKVHRLGLQRSAARPTEFLRAGEGDQRSDSPEQRQRRREKSLARTAAALGISVAALKERRRKKRAHAQVKAKAAPLGVVAVAKPAVHVPPRREYPPERPPVRRRDGPVSLLHLAMDDCRWPLGAVAAEKTMFCGRAVVHGSYCEEHALLAYSRPRGKEGGGVMDAYTKRLMKVTVPAAMMVRGYQVITAAILRAKAEGRQPDITDHIMPLIIEFDADIDDGQAEILHAIDARCVALVRLLAAGELKAWTMRVASDVGAFHEALLAAAGSTRLRLRKGELVFKADDIAEAALRFREAGGHG